MTVSAQDNANGQETSVVRIEISPRSVVLLLATILLVWLAYQLWVAALILVVALILAGTFNPVVEWLDRKGLTRTQSLVAVFITLLGVTVGLVFLTVPPLIEQFGQMIEHAPATRTRLIGLLNGYKLTTPLAHVVESDGVTKMFNNMENYLLGYSSQAVRVLGYGVTSLVLAFYLLADVKRAQGVLYAIVPRDYHIRLARIILNMETIVGGYMRGQLITCVAFGAFTFILLFLTRVPNAMSLAVLAALLDVIPFVGGMIMIVPAVLLALPQGLPTAGVVLVAMSLYIEFESRILVPLVYGQYLRLASTVVILALVAGGLLMGVLGALLALPVAAILLMMLEELRVDLPGDDSVDRRKEARQERTEAAYEQMSAGASPTDAGEIAKVLAADLQAAELAAAERAAAGRASSAVAAADIAAADKQSAKVRA